MQSYVLSFQRKQMPSTFNKTAFWAIYNKLLRGGPSAVEVWLQTFNCKGVSPDKQIYGACCLHGAPCAMSRVANTDAFGT